MQLNQQCMDRILGSQIDAAKIADVFRILEKTPCIPNATLALTIGWQQQGDDIKPGDMVPALTFTLRAPIAESDNAGASGSVVAGNQSAASK